MIARKAVRYFEVAEAGLRFFPRAAESIVEPGRPLADRDQLGGAPARDRVLARARWASATGSRRSSRPRTRAGASPTRWATSWPSTPSASEPGLADLPAEACLVFEDSLAGIISAKGAGMKAVGIAQTYSRDRTGRGRGRRDPRRPASRSTPEWVDRMFGAVEQRNAH